MRREFGSRPRDILAASRTLIRACCYEVGEKPRRVLEPASPSPSVFFGKPTQTSSTAERYPYASWLPSRRPRDADAPRVHLDLAAVAASPARDAGVPLANVEWWNSVRPVEPTVFLSIAEGSRTGRLHDPSAFALIRRRSMSLKEKTSGGGPLDFAFDRLPHAGQIDGCIMRSATPGTAWPWDYLGAKMADVTVVGATATLRRAALSGAPLGLYNGRLWFCRSSRLVQFLDWVS